MKEWRDIAAAIDERVRQLAAQGVSDSALVDQMMGYMQPLQRLWNATTDDELDALCTAYPGFVRYATLMEELSRSNYAQGSACPITSGNWISIRIR